jgi:hypothetical protein
MYRTRQISGAPPPGWSLPPGWGQPLHDPPLLRAAGSVGRWLWPTLSVIGFLVVTAFVLGHDDPAPGVSLRGLCTIALAAAVVILLTLRRTAGPGPLTRALFEYAVVFLLAVLVATTGVDVDQAPTGGKRAAVDQQPALVKTIDGFRDWLSQWRTWAREEADRRPQSSSTTTPALSPPSPGGRNDPEVL